MLNIKIEIPILIIYLSNLISFCSDTPILGPEDVSPSIPESDFQKLTILPNEATKCVSGKTYRVDCNPCLCLSNGNLLCSKMLCLSIDDVNRIKASKASG